MRKSLLKVCLHGIVEDEPFSVECCASDFAIGAVLNQRGRPVAFMSKTLTPRERRYPAVEKEALAIIQAVRKWSHFLYGKKFALVTDHRSLAFMFDQTKRSKIKNAKIELWRVSLSAFNYDIVHRPGKLNVTSNAFSRICGSESFGTFELNLSNMHETLRHPGITRLHHFVRSKNLPYAIQDVKEVCNQCRICAELKPRFFRKEDEILIKATAPWQRISIDFKDPVKGRNNYILVAVDEYSRFPFAFPCNNMNAKTVIDCLNTLFSLFGLPGYIHSDRGSAFISKELKNHLHYRGIATSRTTPYHPTGNAQCERKNQTL